MEKDVVISIKGIQKYEDTDPDVIELVTAGRLTRVGESYTLSYQESELTGLEGTLTTIQAVSYTHLDVYKRQAFLAPAESSGTTK